MTKYSKEAGTLGRCPACGGPVIWARGISEKLDALDRHPHEQGDCHFLDDETYEAVSPTRAAELRGMGIALRFRHVVTCLRLKG